MNVKPDTQKIIDRFCRYVKFDTQSDPNSPTTPSTEKQKELGKQLVKELHEIGISDAAMDEYGYIYATLESNSDKDVPTICFCSHMDTSPDCSGKDVIPIIHKNYQGEVITLPNNPEVSIDPAEHPELGNKIGHDVITASGNTLLGADNKSGLTAIMTAMDYLKQHPEIKHGRIRILFTVDEEIGRGVDKVDIEKLDATYGYTIDGEKAGSLENETFSADAVTMDIEGVAVHPGFAKDKLVSALKVAAEIVASLPKDRLSPETTNGKAGFIHPTSISGTIEKAKVQFIIRDFETAGLAEKEEYLESIVKKVLKVYPEAQVNTTVTEQYRNMKEILKDLPQVVEYAEEAIRRAGLKPDLSSIRGGTDGSRLTFMGLPCPNIFAGEYSFHSQQEWTTVQDMSKAAQTIIHLSNIWEENA